MRMFLSDNQWGETYGKVRTMTTAEFFAAYFSHHGVAVYSALAVVFAVLAAFTVTNWMQVVLPPLLVLLAYPLIEFTVHKYILHNRAFYKHRETAAFWRRVHYDHHMNPNNLKVLFGALWTTLPLVLGLSLPIGYLTLGVGGAFVAASAGLIAFMGYEFFHCAAHLPVRFGSPMMQRLRRHHALHHFHAESGNYGIATDIADKLLHTGYDGAAEMPKSPTVNNLGYTEEEARRYPWVAELDRQAS